MFKFLCTIIFIASFNLSAKGKKADGEEKCHLGAGYASGINTCGKTMFVLGSKRQTNNGKIKTCFTDLYEPEEADLFGISTDGKVKIKFLKSEVETYKEPCEGEKVEKVKYFTYQIPKKDSFPILAIFDSLEVKNFKSIQQGVDYEEISPKKKKEYEKILFINGAISKVDSSIEKDYHFDKPTCLLGTFHRLKILKCGYVDNDGYEPKNAIFYIFNRKGKFLRHIRALYSGEGHFDPMFTFDYKGVNYKAISVSKLSPPGGILLYYTINDQEHFEYFSTSCSQQKGVC